MDPAGYSGIFHFPFRVHAQEELREHEAAGRDFRYRVYAPFLVKSKGCPVTQDVPAQLWPRFRWHDSTPPEMRGEQVSSPELRYKSQFGPALWYDGLRVDIWGHEPQERISPFVLSFMRWLRHLSGQPWISDVDRHHSSIKKRSFLIDSTGAAVGQTGGFAEMVVISSLSLVTNAMWKSAFEHAIWYEVPLHSNLFFDAMNAAATRDYARAIMNLAMSLESCRDVNFARLHPSKSLRGEITRLKAPFNHMDLLRHVSEDAREVFGRDFSAEQPQHWPHLRNLYLARHHVAHGKPPVFPSGSGPKSVDPVSYDAMQFAAGAALIWMETLSYSKPIL
jgi:hypothetical protein